MTPLVAILLAALIQPSDPRRMDTLSDPRMGVLGNTFERVGPTLNGSRSGPDFASRPGILFSFPNRHDFIVVAPNGALAPQAIRGFSHFVRCYRTNKEKAIAPRLLEIVLAAAEHFGVDTVEVISGYRARPYGAPHSKHFLGQALDIRLAGLSSGRLAEWTWKTFHGVGVGYYPRQNFVHIDTRDMDIRWVDKSQRGESGSARYFSRTGRELTASTEPQAPTQPVTQAAADTSRPAI